MLTKKRDKKQHNGISLRTIHLLLIIIAVLLSGLMLYSTYFLSVSFRNMTETSEKHIELQQAAVELMDASNYLTEKVQRFVINGDLQYLQAYYSEAFVMQHREDALNKLSSDPHGASAYKKLKKAMEGSEKLMEKEYYAMRLVVDAKGYKNTPMNLNGVELTKEDEALSSEGKINRAVEMVFDNDYYSQKQQIHNEMQKCVNEINKLVSETDEEALKSASRRLNALRVVIIIETVGLFLLVWLASHLGINPIIKAVDRIKNNSKIPESGTSEFRYLVRAYNRMYEMYKNSIENLNFKASHDELTGVYNRAGYDSLLESIELETTYMLLLDVDNFKSINDTFGHETGDRVLVKVVDVLQKNFRPDDFICRLGGDEFVVFMLHISQGKEEMIASKIEKINKELNETEDGLPGTSISVGIVHGSEADKVDELLKKTDAAMYYSKQKGKQTYTFYTPQIEG